MRPGESLTPNTRYIVAMRNLKTSSGDDIRPEAPFLALRDSIATSLADIKEAFDLLIDTADRLDLSVLGHGTGYGK